MYSISIGLGHHSPASLRLNKNPALPTTHRSASLPPNRPTHFHLFVDTSSRQLPSNSHHLEAESFFHF